MAGEKIFKGDFMSDDILVKAFWPDRKLTAINNRRLAALTLARPKPTKIKIAELPSQTFLGRLAESVIRPVKILPGPTIVVTGGRNLTSVSDVLEVISIPE